MFYAVILLLTFNSDTCHGSGACDYGMAGVSFFLTPVFAGIALILCILSFIVPSLRRRSAFLAPVLGILAVVLAGVVSIILNLKAFS